MSASMLRPNLNPEMENLMAEPVDFEIERNKRHPSPYVDADKICGIAAQIDEIADAITAASLERHGAVDVLAHELCAYASAIRRAVQ